MKQVRRRASYAQFRTIADQLTLKSKAGVRTANFLLSYFVEASKGSKNDPFTTIPELQTGIQNEKVPGDALDQVWVFAVLRTGRELKLGVAGRNDLHYVEQFINKVEIAPEKVAIFKITLYFRSVTKSLYYKPGGLKLLKNRLKDAKGLSEDHPFLSISELLTGLKHLKDQAVFLRIREPGENLILFVSAVLKVNGIALRPGKQPRNPDQLRSFIDKTTTKYGADIDIFEIKVLFPLETLILFYKPKELYLTQPKNVE